MRIYANDRFFMPSPATEKFRSASPATSTAKPLTGYALKWGELSSLRPGSTYGAKEPVKVRLMKYGARMDPKLTMLYQHDPGAVIGGVANGSLRYRENNVGVEFDLDPIDTGLARDVSYLVDQQLVTGVSFQMGKSDGRLVSERGQMIFEADAFEVSEFSIVTWPAFTGATVTTRYTDSRDPRDHERELNRLERIWREHELQRQIDYIDSLKLPEPTYE